MGAVDYWPKCANEDEDEDVVTRAKAARGLKPTQSAKVSYVCWWTSGFIKEHVLRAVRILAERVTAFPNCLEI